MSQIDKINHQLFLNFSYWGRLPNGEPNIPRHQPHHKFRHLRVGIVILVNDFQKNTSPPVAAAAATYDEAEQQQQPAWHDMRRLVSLLPHTPIEQLMEDRPFALACVDRLNDDIFVVFHNWVTDQFNVLKLPQRYHEQFSIFFSGIKITQCSRRLYRKIRHHLQW